jgi:hypothetical protein
MARVVPMLAHQGGWDELLMVLVPILIFALLLVIANRRANTLAEQSTDSEPAGDDKDAGGSPGAPPGGGR